MEYKIMTTAGAILTITNNDLDFKVNPEILVQQSAKVRDLVDIDQYIIDVKADIARQQAEAEKIISKDTESYDSREDLDQNFFKLNEIFQEVNVLNKKRDFAIREIIEQQRAAILAGYQDDLHSLIGNIKLSIGLYAYDIYHWRKGFIKDIPPSPPDIGRMVDVFLENPDYNNPEYKKLLSEFSRAVNIIERLSTWGYDANMKELLDNPLRKYAGIQPYIDYVAAFSKKQATELQEQAKATIKQATALTEDEQHLLDEWKNLLAIVREDYRKKHPEEVIRDPDEPLEELPIEDAEQMLQVFKYVSTADRVNKKLYTGEIVPFKNVPVRTSSIKSKKTLGVMIKYQPPQDMTPLNYFDKAVSAACYSLWEAGNKQQSFASIARVMTGKNDKYNPDKNFLGKIEYSCDKQRRTDIDIDATRESDSYPGLKDKVKIKDRIFPGRIVKYNFHNGKSAAGITFDRAPVLAEYALSKKQIERIDLALLDTGINKTPENIMLQMILEELLTNMNRGARTRTIVYDTVFDTLDYQMKLFNGSSYDKSLDVPEQKRNTSPAQRKKRANLIKRTKTIIDAWKGVFYNSYEEISKGRKKHGLQFKITNKTKKVSKAH
jgi:hypothetical protein